MQQDLEREQTSRVKKVTLEKNYSILVSYGTAQSCATTICLYSAFQLLVWY